MQNPVPRLERRRTKIVATLGPASSSPTVIADLIRAGVDVFRLNMSHGDRVSHTRLYEAVRQQAEALGEVVAVLADLSGPKIRVGTFAGGGIDLEDGAEVVVTTRDVEGAPGLIVSRYQPLSEDVRAGDRILLDDGNLELKVEHVVDEDVHCRVVHGGRLTDRKGMNLPGVSLSTPSLTEKDRADARFALELGVDFLALSFVRSAADVLELNELVHEAGKSIPIIAKIEKPQALDDIDAILDAADGIMIARGDLGVELPPEQVPVAQEQLTQIARKKRKPVIVATQMLESMVTSPSPTRAEVADVALAVRSGADAVMLSAETAAGDYPVPAVRMMDRVARHTEGYLWQRGAFGSLDRARVDKVPVAQGLAIARSTAQLSRDLQVRSIVVISHTGTSAREVSSSRPAAPVIALSDSEASCRRMVLLWGVVPVQVGSEDFHPSRSAEVARRLARDLGLATEGQYVLVVRGFHVDPRRNTPSITVLST